MAEKLWPDHDAVGKMFALDGDPKHPIQVVGVAKNSRNYDFSGPVDSYFYLPLAQHYRPDETLQVRTKAPHQNMPLEMWSASFIRWFRRCRLLPYNQ